MEGRRPAGATEGYVVLDGLTASAFRRPRIELGGELWRPHDFRSSLGWLIASALAWPGSDWVKFQFLPFGSDTDGPAVAVLLVLHCS
jgi:hypothetical protein